MSLIKIKSNIRDYNVCFGKTREFLSGINKRFVPTFYVVDANVWKLYEETLSEVVEKSNVVILPINEEQKCLGTVEELYDRFIELSVKRNMSLVSIGGGIIQDITGFVASTLYRGVNWIFIPTTLLAQADSCIGSKTSLNYKAFKNLIGTFYPPSEIFIDTTFLATQEDVDYYSGLGEVVKLHLVGGEDKVLEVIKLLPELCLKKNEELLVAVRNSLLIKQSYIEGDEFDTGRRNLLNFGHCFGHALETTSNFEVPHGQAVVLGMILSNIVARGRRILSDNLESFILDKLLLPCLKVKLKKQYFDHQSVIDAMQRDKKRTGKDLALIMMIDDYKMVKVNDLSSQEASKALEESLKILNIHGD